MSYEAGIIIIESLGWQITLIDAIVALFALIMAFVGLAKVGGQAVLGRQTK